jgi:steroid delta-isomerase-like uncharacterized protein
MSPSDDPVGTITAMVERMNAHDLDGCVECYSEDAELQDPRFPEPVHGLEYVREGFRYWFNAFPDVAIEVVKLIVDGSDVAVEWTFEATHLGEYLDVPPSGRRFKVLTAAHFRVENGKVTRDFSLFDASGLRLLEELGGGEGQGAVG